MQTQYGDVPDASLCQLHDFEVRINVRISSLVICTSVPKWQAAAKASREVLWILTTTAPDH